MKVKIGNVEISDLTLEELDKIVDRYAGDVSQSDANAGTQGSSLQRPTTPGGTHADKVLLTKLVAAETSGVAVGEVAQILQRRGRAFRGAMDLWARRTGLKDGNIDPWEFCRVGTKKHVRIRGAVLDVARKIVTGK